MAGFFSRFLINLKRNHENNAMQATATPQDPLLLLYVQIAIYDSIYNPPRVLYITSHDYTDLTHTLTNETFAFASAKGGQIPYVSIKEVIDNLIHADFKDVVITILADGNTIRIADRGSGIKDKQKVFFPGFSTATADMKKYIKGVGSGLTIAREALGYFAGQILIEDNLETGSVITLHIPTANSLSNQVLPECQNTYLSPVSYPLHQTLSPTADPPYLDPKKLNDILSTRQKKILLLIAEINETGPSSIAKELNMSLSTAYRELVYLEELTLVAGLNSGKRKLTDYGLSYISSIFE